MQVGDLVKIVARGKGTEEHVINLIVSVRKIRNNHGSHDSYIKVLGCGDRVFHQSKVKVLSESR